MTSSTNSMHATWRGARRSVKLWCGTSDAARLYFVDCRAGTLHWLDDGDGEPAHAGRFPRCPPASCRPTTVAWSWCSTTGCTCSIPTPAVRAARSLPRGARRPCNDACADLDGNLITGKLNLGPAEGSAWWYSADRRLAHARRRHLEHERPDRRGARRRDDADHRRHVGAVLLVPLRPGDRGGRAARPCSATSARSTACPTARRSTPTAGCGARSSAAGSWRGSRPTGSIARCRVPVANPTDVTFGGPDLDRLYVTSIAARRGRARRRAARDRRPRRVRPAPSPRARGSASTAARTRSWNCARRSRGAGSSRPVS